jgi:hypothetical protein
MILFEDAAAVMVAFVVVADFVFFFRFLLLSLCFSHLPGFSKNSVAESLVGW